MYLTDGEYRFDSRLWQKDISFQNQVRDQLSEPAYLFSNR
jgi:hypothetical protein